MNMAFMILNEILYNHHITNKYCEICYNLSEVRNLLNNC